LEPASFCLYSGLTVTLYGAGDFRAAALSAEVRRFLAFVPADQKNQFAILWVQQIWRC
jgi:hypothetical protein